MRISIDDDRSRAEKLAAIVDQDAVLSEEDALCLLLCDTSVTRPALDTARELIARFGGLHDICSQSVVDLASINGVGRKGAMILKGCLAVSHYIISKSMSNDLRVFTYDELCNAFRPYFAGEEVEKLYALYLNSKYRVIKSQLISIGGKKRLEFDPRVIIRTAVDTRADYVALAHNHNISSVPSTQDAIMTAYIENLLEMLDVKFLDHLVFCDNHVTSMRRSGHIDNMRKNLLKYDNVLEFVDAVIKKQSENE